MEDVALVDSGCHNGICAIGCGVGCIVTGGTTVGFGMVGGIIGAWG